MADRNSYYITTAISYPNGVPHVGHAYEDVATDAIQGTGDAIQRNPLAAIGIGIGVGFLLGRSLGGRH